MPLGREASKVGGNLPPYSQYKQNFNSIKNGYHKKLTINKALMLCEKNLTFHVL